MLHVFADDVMVAVISGFFLVLDGSGECLEAAIGSSGCCAGTVRLVSDFETFCTTRGEMAFMIGEQVEEYLEMQNKFDRESHHRHQRNRRF